MAFVYIGLAVNEKPRVLGISAAISSGGTNVIVSWARGVWLENARCCFRGGLTDRCIEDENRDQLVVVVSASGRVTSSISGQVEQSSKKARRTKNDALFKRWKCY